MKYVTVTEGERRTFTITSGLSEGYGDTSKIHHPRTANRVIGDWMQARSNEKLLTISGFCIETELHYTHYENGDTTAKQESGVRFSGEVSIRRLSEASDDMIVEALNDLADALGSALGQEHVIVSYRDKIWVRGLQAE